MSLRDSSSIRYQAITREEYVLAKHIPDATCLKRVSTEDPKKNSVHSKSNPMKQYLLKYSSVNVDNKAYLHSITILDKE